MFEKIRDQYGYVASWAVWCDAGEKPKSNIGNMDIFELEKYRNVLQTLNANVVIIGLNLSREVRFERPYMNFHDSNSSANDFKLRYAFKDTPFYGAYMTDIIKNLEIKSSKDVLIYLKNNSHVIVENINAFRQELEHIQSKKPIILAFGADAFKILKNNLRENEYSCLVKLTHYSHQINKDDYKAEVHRQLYCSLKYIPSATDFLLSVDKEIKSYISMINVIENVSSLSERDALKKVKRSVESFSILLGKIENS